MKTFLWWLSFVWVSLAAAVVVGLLAYVAWVSPGVRFDIIWFAFSCVTGAAMSYLLCPRASR